MSEHKIKENARSGLSHLKDEICNACGNAMDTAKYLNKNLRDFAHIASEDYDQAHKKIIDYTHKKPLKALGLALLAGYIVSKII